ncbi:phosphotransferase enzyme family protein [Paenibacillus sacheonensis]|uniref:Phosphotransferase n=1 Tax=Paenibacillus sacheonensis TaxID=742054 RepID=A0A7X4YQJ2_9BACL|nr:phosphotransferase [Paenibacillus sacheonensis]MBM7566713.1 Ser/Thr protein kinase RdoA (MazF antagonist) [Paenibacillus sacheonensis]NBC70692.1 phosphotransferase [Paenibacillus sacheonensis]
MHLFPASYTLLSREALLAHIRQQYDIDEPRFLHYFLRGMNDTYLLETETARYMFRVYRADRRTISDIAFELDLLTHLAGKGVPVSTPIARRDGTLINAFPAAEGTKHGVLFTFAEGTERRVRTADDSRGFGQSVARMHEAASTFASGHPRSRIGLDVLIDRPLDVIGEHLAHRQEDIAFLRQRVTELRERLQPLIDEGLDFGICHGDLHGNTNVAYTEDGRMTHYDFDLCGYGWRAYDIAEFRLAREIHSGHDPAEVEALWSAFLDGYRSERILRAQDEQAVPIFVALRQLWLFALCFSESELIGAADFDDGFIDGKMAYFRALTI